MSECLFCKISSHDIPTEVRYEDNEVIAFDDIHPSAPIHILIVPKIHITGVETITNEDSGSIMKVFRVAQKLINQLKIGGSFKLVVNGPDVRHVNHLHFHLLAPIKTDNLENPN